MKRILAISIILLAIGGLLSAQTLNVQVGNVTYQFPAAQAGAMPYNNGTTLTVMGKTFNLSEINSIYIDETAVTDNQVSVAYNGSTAAITVAGNVAQYLTINQSGAHVSIAQSSDLAQEITYTLSGTSTDGGFYTSGSYKATVELNGLRLTNVSATYSGAAIHVQNSKRIKVKVVTGTVNVLEDASTGSQKGCLYIKGHAEFAQKGTLKIIAHTKHGIKTGEYMTVKNATINIVSAVGDGINCTQYFLMESGSISISGVGDDGLQCDIEDTTTGSTGQTANHEGEDSGNVYVQGGVISISLTATAAKGIKAEGDIIVTGGQVDSSTSGNGTWDSTDLETTASAAISADGNIALSGGVLRLLSSGSGGKGLKCDGTLTISDSVVMVINTTGGLYYNNGTTENYNYTGNTDRISNSYYSSPKGIKATGVITISGGQETVNTVGRNGEGIESKSTLLISGGQVTVNAYDDAINSAGDLTISGGLVYARATNNDGLDANGNVYIQGGLIFAVGSTSPEVGIDANSEEQKKLYVTGGTIVAIGGLESGASLSQTCYSAGSSSSGGSRPGGGSSSRSWTTETWYALTYGGTTFAFKTPSSGGSSLVVSAASTPTLKSGVTVTGGTNVFGGVGYTGATFIGGTAVTLSTYSGGGAGRW